MVYTEIKQRDKKKYYYRVRSMRNGKKFKKQRIYLGKNLSKKELLNKEKIADSKLEPKRRLKGLEKLKPKILKILKEYKIKKAGIFGSYARGEEKKNSDIDILIQPVKNMGFEFAGVAIKLEEELGKKVHLVTYKYINPYIKTNILKEEIRII